LRLGGLRRREAPGGQVGGRGLVQFLSYWLKAEVEAAGYPSHDRRTPGCRCCTSPRRRPSRTGRWSRRTRGGGTATNRLRLTRVSAAASLPSEPLADFDGVLAEPVGQAIGGCDTIVYQACRCQRRQKSALLRSCVAPFRESVADVEGPGVARSNEDRVEV